MAIPVLIVAHHFPPMWAAGVRRSFQFVKSLPDYGYTPVVLTISLDDIKAGKYYYDESLLEQLPQEVSIIRTKSGEPRTFKKLLRDLRVFRIFWYLFYHLYWETSAFWPKNAVEMAGEAIKSMKIPLVYTSSGPFSALLIGYQLKKKYGIKWVADMRDAFTDGYMWNFPSKLHWRLARRWERRILAHADQIIVATPGLKVWYDQLNIPDCAEIKVILNGYGT